MKRRSVASVVAGEGTLFDACVATLVAITPPAHHQALAKAIAGELGDGCVRVAHAMHHWQLIDDRTLALLAHLSHHFPAYETHRLDLATCTHLSEEALIETASLWRHLTTMATPRASDELLRALSRSAVAQTLGEVSFCSQCDVTLQGLRHLGAFAKLRKLELSFYHKHKEQAIGVLRDVCPQLEQLSMPMPRWTADVFAQLPNITSLHNSRLSLETLEQLHATGRLKHLTSLRGCVVLVDCEEAGKALVDLLSEPDSQLVEGPTFERFAVRALIKRITSQQQNSEELLAPLASWTGLTLWDQAWPSASLVPVLRAFPVLRKLELEADNRLPSSQLTFASVAAGFEALPHLNELVLVGFRCNDAASLAALLSSDCTAGGAGGTWQSSLTKLTLHSAHLSGAFIAAMAHGLSGLTSLDLDQATTPSGEASAEHEPDESLTKALSERGGEGDQPKLAQLRSLTLSGFFRHHQPRRRGSCSGAGETGCRFHLRHPLLEHLVIYGCGSASDDDEDEDDDENDYDGDDNDDDDGDELGRPLRIGLTIECAELRSCRIDARDMHSRDLVRTVTSLSESSPLLTSVHVSLGHDLDFDDDDDHDDNDSGNEARATAGQQPSWIPQALHRLVSACPLLTTVTLTGQPLGVAPSALQRLAQAQEAAQSETQLAVAPMDDDGGGGGGGGGANLQRLELSGRWLLSGGGPLSVSAVEPKGPPFHGLLVRFSRLTRLTLDANCLPANSRDHPTPFAEAELRALALLPSLEKLSIRGELSGEGDCEDDDDDQGATLAIEGASPGAGGGHQWPRLRSVKVRHARLAVVTIRHMPRLETVRLVTHSPKALVMWLAVAHCPCLAQVRVRAAAPTPELAVRLVSHVNDAEAEPVAGEGAFAGCPALRSLRLEPADRMRISSADLATVVAACPLVQTVPARSGGCVTQ